jgi:anti-sigma regulatory factor (Ser/Thr protein kinase)
MGLSHRLGRYSMHTILSVQPSAEPLALEQIRQFVAEAAANLGVDQSATYDLLLAVDEVAMNIMAHGYRGRGGTIEIEIVPDQKGMAVSLRDQAPCFDPTRVPPPDTSLPLERRAPGGLGIHLARHFTDAMIYRPLAPVGNELTLIKHDVCGRQAEEEARTSEG